MHVGLIYRAAVDELNSSMCYTVVGGIYNSTGKALRKVPEIPDSKVIRILK